MHLEYLNFSHTLPSYLDYSEIRKRKCLKKFSIYFLYIAQFFCSIFGSIFTIKTYFRHYICVYISFYHFKTKFLTLSLKIINIKAN